MELRLLRMLDVAGLLVGVVASRKGLGDATIIFAGKLNMSNSDASPTHTLEIGPHFGLWYQLCVD